MVDMLTSIVKIKAGGKSTSSLEVKKRPFRRELSAVSPTQVRRKLIDLMSIHFTVETTGRESKHFSRAFLCSDEVFLYLLVI